MSGIADRMELLRGYLRARHMWRFGTRAALERHQQRRIRRFMATTLRRSPFYMGYADGPLAAVPVMTKRLMTAHFDAINTRGIRRAAALQLALAAEESRDFSADLDGISVGLSTGTSGERGLFLASVAERMRWAGIIMGRMLPGSLLQVHRIAFFLRANNQLYESVAGRGRITFRFLDLLTPLATHFATLRQLRPTILIAPAQVLRELAIMQAKDLGDDVATRLTPQRVISVAETLFADDRAIITEAFGCRVDQIYQCTEGFLGYTCRQGRLHLNEAFVHIEPDWLDDAQTRFAPIITDFSRETQPIVRYRLDDVLTIDPAPCPCGSAERRIARIEGRADDILMLPARGGGGSVHVMPDYVVRALAGAALDDFRVVQTGPHQLDVQIAATDFTAATSRAAGALVAMCGRLAIDVPELRFVQLAAPDRLTKRRRVVGKRGTAP